MLLTTSPSRPVGSATLAPMTSSRSHRLRALLAALAMASVPVAHAQHVACGDKSLAPDQRWNPRSVSPSLARFYSLQESLSKSVAAGDHAQAESLAVDYLEAAKRFPCNWNYGNAIHDANVVLGLGALRQGNRDDAVRHLRAAGRSPGSPQLDTFGPAVALADALAKEGEYGEVVAYLRDVQRFWEMDRGKLVQWILELEAGRVPDFGIQLLRPL